MPRRGFVAIAALSALSAEAQEQTLRGAAAFGDWRSDAPGVTRKITPADLPEPYVTTPAATRSDVVPRPAGAAPKAPEGFHAEIFAEGLEGPRVIRVAPGGDVFVAETNGGRVRAFRLDAARAKPQESGVFAQGLDRPYGLAFYPPGPAPTHLYVATETQVRRYPYRAGALAAAGPAEIVIDGLPSGGHWTRDIVFAPDGKTLYVAVGSKTNVAEGFPLQTPEEIARSETAFGLGAAAGPERQRAAVLAFDPDGKNRRVFATGLRNCSGMAIRPGSDELWCVVNERDMLGDDLPPDYATRVRAGAFYGWPWRYIGEHVDPRHIGERRDLAGKVTTPDVLLQAHSAPLGIAFYDGAQFPPDYAGDAFVALHGSWNRAKRTGYKVVRLRFANGAPTGDYQDFLTGFALDDAHVFGRPVDVAVAPDGALLITEDGNGVVWRVSRSTP